MRDLMRWSTYLPAIIGLALLLPLVNAQQNATTSIVDPNAVCSQADQDRIQTCLRQVDADELRIYGSVCTPPQWPCVCEKQQGILNCYTWCLGTVPLDLLAYVGKECAGAHKISSKIRSEGGKVAYAWSTLPVPPGAMTPIEADVRALNTPAQDPSDMSKSDSDIKMTPSFVGFTDSTSHITTNGAESIPAIKPFVELVTIFAFLFNVM